MLRAQPLALALLLGSLTCLVACPAKETPTGGLNAARSASLDLVIGGATLGEGLLLIAEITNENVVVIGGNADFNLDARDASPRLLWNALIEEHALRDRADLSVRLVGGVEPSESLVKLACGDVDLGMFDGTSWSLAARLADLCGLELVHPEGVNGYVSARLVGRPAGEALALLIDGMGLSGTLEGNQLTLNVDEARYDEAIGSPPMGGLGWRPPAGWDARRDLQLVGWTLIGTSHDEHQDLGWVRLGGKLDRLRLGDLIGPEQVRVMSIDKGTVTLTGSTGASWTARVRGNLGQP